MKEDHINLGTLIAHGKAETRVADGMLDFWTTHSVTPYTFNLYGDSFKKHNVALPGRYHLPFRIDMTVRLDYPMLILLIGDGHITFSSPWQDNRKIEDIAKPTGKPNQGGYTFDNSLPLGEFTELSVTFSRGEAQVLIGGEERFYSRKLAYMKSKDLDERNAEGFEIKLAVSKLSTLRIKNIAVTEYDGIAPITRGVFSETVLEPGERVKATFESVTAGLPEKLKEEIQGMDSFFKSLRPLKFKRTVDKNGGKITYVASDFGISYAFNVSGAQSSQHFGWYMVVAGKAETWHVKADNMEELLVEIAKSNTKLAERIFYALNDCVGCYGSRCLAKRPYAFGGRKRLACHGRVMLRACDGDFHDTREFFRHLNDLMERKIAAGGLTTEKIFLKNKSNT